MSYKYNEFKVGQDEELPTAWGLEWTPRRGRKRTFAQKRQQNKMLKSLALAVGFMAYPYGLGEAATEIVPKGGTAISPSSDNVYQISPQADNGTFAYNRFEKFNLGSGDIANLLFGNSSTLANLVNNKINIEGIVNGIKDDQINGHLIFLSPEGIAVGASGVINAGQFTGIVPDVKEFEKLYNSQNAGADITVDNVMALNNYANDKTIDISGHINTHSGIMLGAGIININDGSRLQSTKNLDFQNLVKINAADAVSADLHNITAVVEGTGGDIILTAKQESAVKDTKTENNTQSANPIRWKDRSTDLSAAINIGQDKNDTGVAISSSDGAVKLTAESTSNYEDSTPMSLTDTLKGIVLGENTIAEGVINQLAGQEAAANKYLFVNYSGKKNKAAVNIGQNSEISGKNIDIAATAKVDIRHSVAVPEGENKKDSTGTEIAPNSAAAVAAVSVSRIYNTADIVIDGKMTADGADNEGSAIKLSANADTKAALSTTAGGGANTAVAVGVAVLAGDTKANVTINESANALEATQGKVGIAAVTSSDVDIKAGAVGTGKNYAVSTVGVANYDTKANVNINRSIQAGALDIKADNKTTGLKMNVDNTLKAAPATDAAKGKDTAEANDTQKADDNQAANDEKAKAQTADEAQNAQKSTNPTKAVQDTSEAEGRDKEKSDDAGTGEQKVKDKVAGTNESGTNAAKNSAFGVGAGIGIFANQNDANITLGRNAVIHAAKVDSVTAADGSVSLAANSLLMASKDKTDTLQFTVKNAQANSDKVEIGAAVMVSKVKNNAKILLDNEGEKSAQITGTGAVKLDAQAGMGKYKKEDDKPEETSVLAYTVNTEGAADKNKSDAALLEGSVGINTQKNNAIVLLGQQSKVEGSKVSLSSNAVTNGKGSYGAKEENSKVGIGATVGIQNISSNSLLMAGKGVELTGTESVSASAKNSLDTGNEVKNAGKGDSLGVSGMVALSYGDSNSILSLDDEVRIKAPTRVSLTANNATSVDNSARSASEGRESSKAFGIGVGIINYDVNNLALVSDNGQGISAPSGNTTDAEKAAQKIHQDSVLAQSIAGETLTAQLGQKTAANAAKGSLVTKSLTLSAVTTGSLQNDAKAKVVSKTAADKKEDANSRKDSEKWTQWSKKGEEGANDAKQKTNELEKDEVKSKNEEAAPTASEAAQEAGRAANKDNTTTPQNEESAPAAGSSGAGASVGIEGSAALTFLGGRTDAILNNVNVKNETAENAAIAVDAVKLSALDFLNTITLAGTDIRNSVKPGNSATKVGIGGTFVLNSANRDVDSILRNAKLDQVKSVSNSAAKVGIELAAGMGVTASRGNGTNIAGAGVVYYNKARQDIHALMLDNTVTSADDGRITNKVTGTDFQIAGGLAANFAAGQGTNVGVGGAVAISNLENDMSGGIIGGTYANKFQSVDVTARKGTIQINGALAATFAGGKSGYGFEGALAYGSVKNTTRAYISGVSGDGLKAIAVNVKAGDSPVPDTAESQEKKDADTALLTEKGIDPTGRQYIDSTDSVSTLDANTKAGDTDKAAETEAGKATDEAADDENAAKAELGTNKTLTITAAMAGGWNGKAGVGAGIAYNYVKNDIAADIRDSVIHADNLNGEAAGDSLIVSVGAGIALGGKSFSGAGSGSWNDIRNDTGVTFANNTITGKTITEKATNAASIINIAGETAGGQGSALGLSLAYNSLNNTTGTYLLGNDITMEDGADTITLDAGNTGKVLAIAAGVQVSATSSSLAGASGTVAINRGTNSTESVIDGKQAGSTFTNTKLENVKNLSVKATDITKKTTVAGGVAAGGSKTGIGGAVAYTAIGTSGNKEKLRAEINHVNLKTGAEGNIQVSASDSRTEGTDTEKSRITTVGAGLGVAWGRNLLNLQGAAAVSDIYKDTHAAIHNTNINQADADYHPAIRVEADSKGKINTVGAVGSINVTGTVTGAAGVAINRLQQDTTAEMAADTGRTTKVNAGLTQVRATGDSDIHSVGVGGAVSVAGTVAVAGSGSYNYSGNNVNALIRNQNLTANSSVGIVARSDDRIYNFAGGFSVGIAGKAAIGAAVSMNKITGNTNARVQGGAITAANTGSIKVTRPQDDRLNPTESLHLTADSTALSDSRTEEDKTGLVVDSSATHTLISQLASGGAAASADAGVGLAGTVNLNTIEGETTAKIENTDINSAAGDSSAFSNVHVNALDYTNFNTFTGTPAVGVAAAAGVSLGVSANWETFARDTEASISSAAANNRRTIKAKDLLVHAVNKHGSSNLAFAAAIGGGATAGVASGDSIVRRRNTGKTTALLQNTNVTFAGNAEILAEHFGGSHSRNISASASAGYAAVAAGAGVSVVDDNSKVQAEVADSDLKETQKATGDNDKKTISVQAKNENNWNSTLATASAAIGLGAALAGNVGINTTTAETAATVSGASRLQATDVQVNAADKLKAEATGGVGAAGVAGVGVSVALHNINSSVSANVTGGTIQAAKDVRITAEEVRDFSSSVTGAAAGGMGIGVNVAVTSVNKGITDARLSNATDENGKSTNIDQMTKDEIDMHLQKVNNAKGAVGVENGRFFGLSEEDKNDLAAAKNVHISLAVPDTGTQGTHTLIREAALIADGDVKVLAQESNDIAAKNVTVTVGGNAVGVTDAIIHTNYDTDVTIDQASVTGKNVAVEARQGQQSVGSNIEVTAVSVGAGGIGVGVGYAGIVNKGSTDVDIKGSTIGLTKGSNSAADMVNAENVNIRALDESKSTAGITNVGVAAVEATTTFANVENNSNVGVTLADKDEIAALKTIHIDAKKANELNAHTAGVGVGGAAVAVNHATIDNKGGAAAEILGTAGKYTAEMFRFGAADDTKGRLSAGNTTVSLLGISRMRGKGDMALGAEVNVTGGSFNAKTVDFIARLGDAGGRMLEGNVKGHNVSAGAVAPDTVVLNTDATSGIIVKNSTFTEKTDLILDNASYVDRKAYIYGLTAGAVAVGNTGADISGTETLESSLTGTDRTTKLNSLMVLTNGQNTGKAFADAGGGGLVDYVGAYVNNKSINKVSSTLGGKWKTAEDIWVMAVQNDETRLTASEGHGGVAGVGGTVVGNKIETATNAKVEDGAVINADSIRIGTSNTITTDAYDDNDADGNRNVQSYTLKDHFGGVISGNRLRSLLDITETGTVTIGKNAQITTNNLQEYIADSKNVLTNNVQAKGGGAVVATDTVTENIINVHNQVDVQSGVVLSNEEKASMADIVLSAYDDQSLHAYADATVQAGVVSPLAAKNETTMNRTSMVMVAGNIASGSNVGLYAGANKTGARSNLNVDLKAGAYNYSVIPITSPTVDYTIKADKGSVDVSGTVRSTRDINVIAGGGREEIAMDESKWAWTNGGSSTDKKFLTSYAVTKSESSDLMKQSTVNVTGALIAGTADPINLTIGGTVADGLTLTADNNLTNQRVKDGVTQGTFDYANTLGSRLEELNRLIAAYDGADENESKMAAYIAERDRIQNKMKELGLVETDENGNVTAYVNSGRPVYYVEIPDIATSGGNINVEANDLKGTGRLHANTAPSITIQNSSDAYLKVNNILMGEQGGNINYSDMVIPPGRGAGNPKINELNVHNAGAAFSEIYGRTDGTAPGLTVEDNFNGPKESTIKLTKALEAEIDAQSELTADEKAQYKQDIKDGKMKYTAVTDVEINGKISNAYGSVTIKNTTDGDIRISGGTKERPTGVSGVTVNIVSNGTIAQDYKEGIVNINGDPENYLDTAANQLKTDANLSTTTEESKSGIADYTRDVQQEATGYIAGRDVYVSAANINVNGLIQSGYKNYAATVTQEQLDAAKTRPSERAAVVQNRTMYKVNDGGAKWNSTDKAFDYEAQVYWDPAMDRLVVEDIDTQGGKVYLTGMIAGTGGGRILAADGAADISVVNRTALDMNVGKVINNQREGIITIADIANDTWTEYKRGQTRRITGYAQYLKDHAQAADIYADATIEGSGLSVGHDLQYNTKAGQTYSWINGNSVETTLTYEHYERYGMWGAVKTKDDTELKGLENESSVIDEVQGAALGLPEGAVIAQDGTGVPEAGKLNMDAQSKVIESKIFDQEQTVKRSGFAGWFKNVYNRWKEGISTIQLYNYTLNASQPISIGLLGTEKGSIRIENTNTAGGNINLTDNVANSHNEATLTVNAAAGGIFQNDNTTLKSEIVNLSAKKNIGNIQLASLGTVNKDANGNIISVDDKIRLNAVSTGKGDISITAVGGLLENRNLPGNVEITALKSRDGNVGFRNDVALGDVTLNAAGNITQSGNGTYIEGRGIYLTSKEGNIGTAEQAINLAASDMVYATDRYGAQVNAGAKGNIYLTEAENGGDMRVGRIESKSGDVTLTVTNGGFIDGLPGDDKSGSAEGVDEMVHRWIDAGLIAGEKDANGNYTYKGAYIEGLEKNRDDYRANVELAYKGNTQVKWQAEYAVQKTAVEGIYASAGYRTYLDNKARYDALSQEERRNLADHGDSAYLAYAKSAEQYAPYSKYETAEAFLKETAAYKYSRYADANAYLQADATYKELVNTAAHPTFDWTKDMMLYAVSEKLVNPEGGSSTQTDRAANVLGRNITLNAAKGAVGAFSDQTVTITAAELSGDSGINKMKQLMNVNAADVTVKRDADGNPESFEIKGNMPLGIKAGGTLNVLAGGNVAVAGRKDAAGENSAINVGHIDATRNSAKGDVRLHSDMGIYNALAANAANPTNITGNHLILTGGKESIGTADKALTISLTGDLTEARADKNIFLRNMNTEDYLRLGAMFAGDTISLVSEKGFKMSEANAAVAESYINAGRTLEFKTDATTGIVGEENNAIRILNDRAPVNIKAREAHIHGMSSVDLGIRNGTLVLGDIRTVGNFTAVSDGSLAVGRDEEKADDGTVKEAVKGTIKAGSQDVSPDKGNISLIAGADVNIHGDIVTGQIMPAPENTFLVSTMLSNRDKYNSLTITAGGVVQEEEGAKIETPVVNTYTGKGVSLESSGNRFAIFLANGLEHDKQNIHGSVRAVTDYEKDDTHKGIYVAGVSVKNIYGDAVFTNLAEHGEIRFLIGNQPNSEENDTLQLLGGDIVQAAPGSLRAEAGDDVTVLGNIKAKKDIVFASTGEGSIYGIGKMEAGNDVCMLGKDEVYYIGTMTAGNNIDVEAWHAASAKDGNGIHIGTVPAMLDLPVDGETLLEAGKDMNFIVKGTGDINLEGRLVAAGAVTADITEQGNIHIGRSDEKDEKTITAKNDVMLRTGQGNIVIVKGIESLNESIKLEMDKGDIIVGRDNVADEESLMANRDISLGTNTGTITIQGYTVTKNGDISMKAGKDVYVQGKNEGNFIIREDGLLNSGGGINLYGRNGDIYITDKIRANKGITTAIKEKGSVVFEIDVTAKGNVNLTVENGDIHMHDVTADGNVTVSNTVQGSINAHNIISGGITHVALSQGDLFLNLAEGKGVFLQMENNTEASKVNQVLAEAGGTGPDVVLTGNYIQIGSLKAKGGDAVFEVSAMGAGNRKLISGNFSIGSLVSQYGTHMPNLWSNRGYIHVDEGALLLDDVLAVDKIHLDNAQTDIAIFGRTPTRDGEQLTYWNNLSIADSKARGYQLYTDGRVRTYGTVLFDAGMNLPKLDGDNLSVLDMMNERETGRHGVFTFDRRMFTEPGKRLLEQVIFDPKMWDFAGRQSNETEETATDKEE